MDCLCFFISLYGALAHPLSKDNKQHARCCTLCECYAQWLSYSCRREHCVTERFHLAFMLKGKEDGQNCNVHGRCLKCYQIPCSRATPVLFWRWAGGMRQLCWQEQAAAGLHSRSLNLCEVNAALGQISAPFHAACACQVRSLQSNCLSSEEKRE